MKGKLYGDECLRKRWHSSTQNNKQTKQKSKKESKERKRASKKGLTTHKQQEKENKRKSRMDINENRCQFLLFLACFFGPAAFFGGVKVWRVRIPT